MSLRILEQLKGVESQSSATFEPPDPFAPRSAKFAFHLSKNTSRFHFTSATLMRQLRVKLEPIEEKCKYSFFIRKETY